MNLFSIIRRGWIATAADLSLAAAAVLAEHPYLARPLMLRSRLATRFFLEELARRRGGGAGH